jgi:hypothetical protein
MKPTSQTISDPRRPDRVSRRFPVTDFNYHSIGIRDYKARCAKYAPTSFRDISREYFNDEESLDFLANAFVFGLMSLTAALPLWNAAKAIFDLLGAVSF